jgi:hypothetical protein
VCSDNLALVAAVRSRIGVHAGAPGPARHHPSGLRLGGGHAFASRGRSRYSRTALYILYRESLLKYTGRCENAFSVHGCNAPEARWDGVALLGSGSIAVSETEAPNLLVNMA